MPVDGVGGSTATTTSPYNFSTGANAEAAKSAEEARSVQTLSDEEKAKRLLEAVNQGQKVDKPAVNTSSGDQLGKDDFMKLLIATLKYQDPSSPMDTQKLLEQTSVMTNMEQMIKMTEASQKAFEAQQRVTGSNLVGKTVVYDAVDEQGNPMTTAGKVDAVEFLSGGECLLHVGNNKIKMDAVLGVADPTEDNATTTKTAEAADKAGETEETAEAQEATKVESADAAKEAVATNTQEEGTTAAAAPAAPPAESSESATTLSRIIAAGMRSATTAAQDAAYKSGNIDPSRLG